MPEMSNKFVPAHMGDKNPNPRLLKLVRKITDRIPAKIKGVKTDDPEYWGFACIFEDEMDEVTREHSFDLLEKMKVRQKYSIPALRKMLKADTEEKQAELDRILDILSRFGLLEYDYGDKYTKDGPIPGTSYEAKDRLYWIPLFVPGSAEYTNMSTVLMDKHPELAMFFERMTFLPLEHVTAMVPPGGAGIGMHVIPVEKAISMESKAIDIEKISYWLKRYDGHIGASICSCRYGRKKLDEGCGDDYEGWCIGVGDMADYCRETGRGYDVTYEQAMEILKRAEDNGFVHQITNIDGEDKIFAICNCNVKICNALRTSQLFNTPNMSASAYRAHVDREKCVACGRCVEYCPAGALKLGQKLCKADGSEVTYPKQELPTKPLKWKKDKWDEDYRDKNRINCHDTGTAPCKTACPAHIAVQGYLKKAAQGDYRAALALIKKENPFPAVCGRVCNRRCEDACTRGTIDSAVSIDAVKKFIAEQDLKAEHRYVPDIIVASNRGRWKEKIAIIGGGPAGLSCAYYLAEMGYYPTVFEKNERAGGMLTYGIPSYKLEKDVIDAEIDIMREMGVEIKTGVEVGKDVTIAELREQGYKGFYIAIGCQGGRLPGIPGETIDGTTTAVEFLRRANTGKQKVSGEIVVVGGGNVAIDAARVAKRSGAGKVTMLCLESRDIMPASKEEIAEAEEDGVIIECGWGPKEVVEKNGKVSVTFKKCTSVYNEDGKFAPAYDEEQTIALPADKVIFAIGQSIEWGNLLDGTKVEFGRGSGPVADKLTYQTAEEDIFVGGDVFTGPKFAIDAIAQGHEAAESLHRYVQHGHMTIGRNRREFIELDKSDIKVSSYDNSSRQEAGLDESVKSKFTDAHKTLTEEQVKIETARCLGCGATVVDQNRCIGCGICTTKCAFDAITLHRDHPEASKMVKSEDKFKHILPYFLKKQFSITRKKKEN